MEKIFGLINVWPKENKKERDNIKVVFSHVHNASSFFMGIVSLPLHFRMGGATLLKKPLIAIQVRKSMNWYASLPAQFKQ